MAEDNKKLKLKRTIRVKKYSADKDPKKDQPDEVIELSEEEINQNT